MEDLEALRAAKAAAVMIDEDVFEDEPGPKPGRTTHHIRANSTIMHLTKILGESASNPTSKTQPRLARDIANFLFFAIVANRGEIRKCYSCCSCSYNYATCSILHALGCMANLVGSYSCKTPPI